MDELQKKKIDEIFQLWLDRPGAGGQMVINYKGEIYERCYGYQDIESGVPMSQDSVFHLASMSKQVTAMCIYMLYERGMLDIDDDVKKYVPDLVKVPQKITISNMLHHTSGLPDHYNFLFLTGRNAKDTVTQAEILRLIERTKELNFEPGQDYGYSNPNFVLLATIVERLTGQTLNQFCQENIFGPLGMTKTFIRDDPEMLIPNRVHSYNDDGYQYTNSILNLCMYGSTTLHSTARDMNVYLRQYIHPTLIRPETMEKFLEIPPLGNGKKTVYASGVFIEEMLGHRYIHHGGVNAGFRNFGVCFPEDDLIITRLANTYNIPFDHSSLDVARIVLGLPEREKKTLDEYVTDTVDLDTVPGFYYSDKSGQNVTITVRDGRVYNGKAELKPQGGNLFKQGWIDVHYAFGENSLVMKDYNIIRKMRKIEDRLTDAQAAEYTGDYICKDFDSRWEIIWQEGKLYLYHLRHGMLELHWLGGDDFCNALAKYTFSRDEQGKVISFNRATDRQKKATFTKE